MKPDYQDDDYTMTVEELRKKLKTIRGDARVYVVLDTSDSNYDEYNGRWRTVHPIEKLQKEVACDVSGLYYESEQNCLLFIQDGFYDKYQVKEI